MISKKILSLVIAATLISCGGADERKAVYLEKAQASIDSGDLDKARIELKNVLQIDPKHAVAYSKLGKIFEQQKNYQKAYAYYLKATELNPDDLNSHARLGRFFLLGNNVEKAKEKMELILAKDSNNTEALLLKGALLVRDNKKDEALALSESLFEKDSSNVENALFLALLRLSRDEPEKATEVLRENRKTNKDNIEVGDLLARILVKLKKFDDAESIYKELLSYYPESFTGYNNLTQFYIIKGDNAKAEEILRKAIEEDPDDEVRYVTLIKFIKDYKNIDAAINENKKLVDEKQSSGKLRLMLAKLYLIKGDDDGAAEIYKGTIKDFSEENSGVEARLNLAKIYLKNNKRDEGVKVIDEAIEISPNNPDINFIRAKVAVIDKDFEKAIISLRIVNNEAPENIDAFLLHSEIYGRTGEEQKQTNLLYDAYENNRTNPEGLLKLARYQITKNNIDQVSRIIDDYLTFDPNNYEALSIKAAVLNQNKEYAEAKKTSERILELYPDKSNGYLQSLPFYSSIGDVDKAISVLKDGFVKVADDNKKILTLLTTLEVENGKLESAESRLESIVKDNPEDAGLLTLLANVELISKDFESSKQRLSKSISIDPSIEDPYMLLARIYSYEGSTDNAIDTLKKGKDNVKESIKIPVALASLYESKGANKAAIDEYKKLYNSYPDNMVIINNLASMVSDYGTKEEIVGAIELADKLLSSDQPVFLDTVGWVYYKNNDFNKAVEYLSAVVEKMPDVNIFNYHMGMAYKMAGDADKAKQYLEKSLADGKDFKQREQAKEALSGI